MIVPPPPKPAFTTTSPYWITAEQIYNALWALSGRNPFCIAALANADMESAFQAPAIGDEDTAFSFWQWHWAPRGQRILANTGIDVRAERSVKKICAALWWELNNVAPYRTALGLMLAAPTYEAATPIFCNLIEGAGATDAAARRVLDAQILGAWVEKNGIFIAQHPAT